MATLPRGTSQIQGVIDMLLPKILERIQSLQSVDLMPDYPNIVAVLHNRINHFLPNLHRTLAEKNFMQSGSDGDDEDDVCNICMANKPVVGLPCCNLNLCSECGYRLVYNHELKCPQCTTRHPETVITSFIGNVFHQLTLVEAAVNIYQTRNIDGLGISRETMYEWLACIDRMLSLESSEEERTKIIEKMVYFGLTKELCNLFEKGWFTHYKFRAFLDRLIFNTKDLRHKRRFETIKDRLTELCSLNIPFTPDSCLRQLNVSYDIMLVVSEVFEILLLPFKTSFSGTFNEIFKVPLSANDLLVEMEGFERHYFTTLGIRGIQNNIRRGYNQFERIIFPQFRPVNALDRTVISLIMLFYFSAGVKRLLEENFYDNKRF